MKKISGLIGMVFAFTLFLASDASALVTAEGRYWLTGLDATVKSTSGGLAGDEIDFVEELGLEDENVPEARITLELGSHRIRYGYTTISWKGSDTLTRSVNYGGEQFNVSTPVDSSLDLDYHRLAYRYDIIDALSNDLGLIFELKYLSGEAGIAAAGQSAKESFDLPIPTIGFGAQIGLPVLINAGVEVTGILLDSTKYLVDAEVMLNYNVVPFITVSGGYRHFQLKYDDGDFDEDFRISGPFVMVRGGF